MCLNGVDRIETQETDIAVYQLRSFFFFFLNPVHMLASI